MTEDYISILEECNPTNPQFPSSIEQTSYAQDHIKFIQDRYECSEDLAKFIVRQRYKNIFDILTSEFGPKADQLMEKYLKVYTTNPQPTCVSGTNDKQRNEITKIQQQHDCCALTLAEFIYQCHMEDIAILMKQNEILKQENESLLQDIEIMRKTKEEAELNKLSLKSSPSPETTVGNKLYPTKSAEFLLPAVDKFTTPFDLSTDLSNPSTDSTFAMPLPFFQKQRHYNKIPFATMSRRPFVRYRASRTEQSLRTGKICRRPSVRYRQSLTAAVKYCRRPSVRYR